jgi:photosystem II stability/assembly factor-like uncharacterized protein
MINLSKKGARFAMILFLLMSILISAMGDHQRVEASSAVSPDGWAWQNPLPQGNDLRAVWASSDTGDAIAVGDSGTVLHHEGGTWTWSSRTSHTRETLNGVWGSSATDVFAVGSGRIILHYDGGTWQTMEDIPATVPATTSLKAVWGSSQNNVFAVGSGGTILRYNGSAWVKMASGTAETLNSVWGSAADHVFAVGSGGTILHYDGSGDVWTEMTSNTSATLNGVWARSASNVFAVGDGGTTLLYDGNELDQWTVKTSPTGQDLHGVWGGFVSGPATPPFPPLMIPSVFAVGNGGTILRYNSFTTEWTEMDCPTTKHLHGVVWHGSTDSAVAAFAVGDEGTIIDYYPFADWWYSRMSSQVDISALSVCEGLGGDVFAVGFYGKIARYDGSSWTEMDSGFDWGELWDVWGSPSTSSYAVGLSGRIIRCSDTLSGVQWQTMSSGLTWESLYGVWGASAYNVFAVGDSGTIIHYDNMDDNDDGSLWDPMLSGTGSHLYDVWGNSATDVFAVGSSGTILHKEYGSWISMNSSTDEDLLGVWCSGSNAFAVGASGTIRHYDGMGEEWQEMTSNTSEILHGVWGSSATDVFAVGNGGTILHYNGNESGTWEPMDSGTSHDLCGVWGFSGSDVFAVGHNGTILHYCELPEITSVTPIEANQGASFSMDIHGSYLNGATDVSFSGLGVEATITTVTETWIQAAIVIDTSADPSRRDVTVTTRYGQHTLAGAFEVLAVPRIDLISPAEAFQGYSGDFEIHGEYFDPDPAVTTVSFKRSGMTVPGITFAPDTRSTTLLKGTLTVAGSVSPGDVDVEVEVTTTHGTDSTTFKVLGLPVVDSVDPDSVAQGQTHNVTITGDHFDPDPGATNVSFKRSGTDVLVPGITVNNANVTESEITVGVTISSDAELGVCDVCVATPGGTDCGVFEVVEEGGITSVTPNEKAQGSSFTMTITGSNLTGATKVEFSGSGITVDNTTVLSDTEIEAQITIASDADPTWRNVSVTTPIGTFTKEPAFKVLPLPVVSSFSPEGGVQGQSFPMTIAGSYLTGATKVAFSGSGITVSDVEVNSDGTQITADVSIALDATTGDRYINVTTPCGDHMCTETFTVRGLPVIAPDEDLVRTNDTSPTFEGTVTDPGQVVQAIEFRVDRSADWLPAVFTRDPEDPTQGSYSFTEDVGTGDHEVQIRAVDSTGNIVGEVVTVDVIVDSGGSGMPAWLIGIIAIAAVGVCALAGYLIWRFARRRKARVEA